MNTQKQKITLPPDEVIRLALEKNYFEDFGNDVLYKMCREYPRHDLPEKTASKIWMINTAYSAGIMRKALYPTDITNKPEWLYTKVAETLVNFDKELEILKPGHFELSKALQIHGHLVRLIGVYTKARHISFASKYLHFHYPNNFFIYDNLAAKSLASMVKYKCCTADESEISQVYHDYCTKSVILKSYIEEHIGRTLSIRQFDRILVLFQYEAMKSTN